MAEFNRNVWAPWRGEYLRGLDGSKEMACFICDYVGDPGRDAANHVICRSGQALILLNRYPYTNGHLLIAPLRHVAELEELSDEELDDLSRRVCDGLRMLKTTCTAEGYNVGMNLGRCAGAGLPGHLHWHIVPRWKGDTNFMSIVGDVRVIPEASDEVFERLSDAARRLGLP